MLRYRAAREDDAEAALAVRRAAIAESLRPERYPASYIEAWQAAAEWPELTSDSTFVVAEEQGVLVGYGYARRNQVEQLYVLPIEQRRGHGSRLLALLERRIAGPFVELQASPDAAGFYVAHGYQLRSHAQLRVSVSCHVEVLWMFKAL